MEQLKNLLCADTVTLYNHYSVNRQDFWQRTVLSGVAVSVRTECAFSEKGLLATRTVRVTIPAAGLGAEGRGYVFPEQFSGAQNREICWTLNPKNNLDTVVIGRCLAQLNGEYTLDALKKDNGCFTVMAVSDNTRSPLLKHWKVVLG